MDERKQLLRYTTDLAIFRPVSGGTSSASVGRQLGLRHSLQGTKHNTAVAGEHCVRPEGKFARSSGGNETLTERRKQTYDVTMTDGIYTSAVTAAKFICCGPNRKNSRQLGQKKKEDDDDGEADRRQRKNVLRVLPT